MTRRRVCATPEPGQTVEERAEQLAADGAITTRDADEIHNFAAFLRATAGIPNDPKVWTPEQRKAYRIAYAMHYPEDYARDMAALGRPVVHAVVTAVAGGEQDTLCVHDAPGNRTAHGGEDVTCDACLAIVRERLRNGRLPAP